MQPRTRFDTRNAPCRATAIRVLGTQSRGHGGERARNTKTQLYGVATFYTMFFFEPKPPVIARVCVNLSCHLRGAQDVLHTLEEAAAAQPGAFEVEEVMCLGLCEQAPALLINENAVGNISAAEVLEKVQASVAELSNRE